MIDERKPAMASTDKTHYDQLGYIKSPADLGLDDDFFSQRADTFLEKAKKKSNENPFVAIGMGATIAVLSVGLWTLKTGNRRMSQKMMRWRIGAQGFTVVALVVGMAYSARKQK